jgi:hypothetical protein
MSVKLQTGLQDEIRSEIEKIRKDQTLFTEKNFNVRQEAIDYLEFHMIDQLNSLMEGTELPHELNMLKEYALQIKDQLEEINNKIFLLLRKKIQEGNKGKVLMKLMDEYFDGDINKFNYHDISGYDNLDIFLNGILTDQKLPVETRDREPEMVYYQKTPARIIFALIEKAAFKPQDVFFDLGSGLGQVAILVNLLGSVMSKGVEYEPAFYNYASKCAADLHVNDVEFIHKDARNADYSSGTVFFMYSPFEGKMLLEVLRNLQNEAKKRRIRIFTYGSCTRVLAKLNWLRINDSITYSSGEFCEFHSV